MEVHYIEDDTAILDYSTDSDSDCSWLSMSSISLDEEYSSDSSVDEISEEFTDESTEFDSDTDTDTDSSLSQIDDTTSSYSSLHSPSSQPPVSSPTHYRLCGDNIDKTVRQRYLRSDSYHSSSLHYFHSYAVKDRVNCFSLSDAPNLNPDLDSRELASLMLPSLEDDKILFENFKVLFSRILLENVEYFKDTFDGTVTWHIKHCYYEEMSMKSDVVSKLLFRVLNNLYGFVK